MISICVPDSSRKEEFLRFERENKKFHEPWVINAATEESFDAYVEKYKSENQASFWILSDGEIAGVINLNEIIRGVFQNAFLGYYGSKKFSGKGVMAKGMKLVLKEAFENLGLHRLECAIRPENEASLRFIRKFNFHFEGYAPKYLFLDGAWRDHFKFSLTREQWKGEVSSVGEALVIPYQKSWPSDFKRIEEKLREKMGNDFPLEHIGSTAVEGLSAKDIMDVQLALKDFSELESLKGSLLSLQFEYLSHIKRDHVPFKEFDESEKSWEKRFFRGKLEGKKVNLHIRLLGSSNWRFALLFRDFLRASKEAKTAYSQLKKRLAGNGVSTGAYAYIKDPVCDLIYLQAGFWAEKTGWKLS